MKTFLAGLPLFATTSKSQPGPAEQLAERISQKMQDSLGLTTIQKDQLYTINMQLHEQKQAARSRYTDPGSLTRQIQQIENTRDSLYRNVLPAEKYTLYKAKKEGFLYLLGYQLRKIILLPQRVSP